MQDKEKPTVYFEKANLSHESCIFSWLANHHVQEFWDNSEDHRKDILIFINGRKEPSPYANGIFDYWIGSIDNHPYCLLMTSEIMPTDSIPEIWKPHLSKKGKTFSLDFAIGDENYVGKGLGPHTLISFTGFIQTKIDSSIDTFIIDPAANNPRAKHVYEKAGFEAVAEFIRDIGFFKGLNHFLMVKKLA
ncbi:MAG: acetyltransferase [Alphaproteobacteria bacterium]|nr:acetyltransferase [Alphaproteobacteria bacterium]